MKKIAPVPNKEVRVGTLGEWKRNRKFNIENLKGDEDERPGTIYISEGLPIEELMVTFAHECGHACTSGEDLIRIGGPSDEWSSEFAADKYAYKWGFGRTIAKYRKKRVRLHHGVGPGKSWKESNGEYWLHYRVTRNFRIVLVRKVRMKQKAQAN